MGIDAEMKVRVGTPLTDDELLTLQAAFREKFPIDSHGDPPYPHIDRDRWERDLHVLAVTMLDRYYGPHYERGDWVHLRKMGDWLMLRFGEAGEVRYGSDSGETDFDSMQPWPDARAVNDAHWAKLGHLPYRPECICPHCETLR